MRRFGLIGYPLGHSFSPGYFAKKFESEGLTDCVYEAFPLKTIHQLRTLLDEHKDLVGLNVTIPYKKSVLRFLEEGSEAVKQIVACNCIKLIDGKLIGYNTDVIGFERSLTPLLKQHHTHALILGTGGSAAAVEYVLRRLNIEAQFVSRSKTKKNAITYGELTKNILAEHPLIINTTPLGMYPAENECPPIPFEYVTSRHYLFDLVYNPSETTFLKKGREEGAMVKNGADMLIIQAEESWRIWNSE